MLSFLFDRKSSLREKNFFTGFTDWHCHILPNADDGAKNMEESLKILQLYEEIEISEVWLTPHIMEDIPNKSEILKERFENLKETYKGAITLHLAAEYMLDNLFMERLEADDLLFLGEGKSMLLVETSFFNPPMKFHDILQNIKSKGIYPLLAHPERYNYMDETEYKKLKEMGIKFQLNLPSLSGMYGKSVEKRAKYLLNKKYYNLTGMDTHNYNQILTCIERKIPNREIEKIIKC